MEFIEKATDAIGKAATKTFSAVPDSLSKIMNVSKRKNEDCDQEKKSDDEFPYKLILKQRPNTVRDKFKIYDEDGCVLYKAKGSFLTPTWTLKIIDSCVTVRAKIRKKLISFRSPLKRYEGGNVEFEIEVNGKKLGRLRSKELGSKFDGIGKQIKDLRKCLIGTHYEYDFTDMEIVDKGLIFRYEIYSKDGDLLSKAKKSFWSYGDCYTISYSNKEDELLYLIMVLAMDFLHDGRTMTEKMDNHFTLGSSNADY